MRLRIPNFFLLSNKMRERHLERLERAAPKHLTSRLKHQLRVDQQMDLILPPDSSIVNALETFPQTGHAYLTVSKKCSALATPVCSKARRGEERVSIQDVSDSVGFRSLWSEPCCAPTAAQILRKYY